jgi:8-oxo-dGTP pyrophosphatase MutT (NUDIX family)
MNGRLANFLRRTAYRLGYPLARAWWWLTRPSAEGVAVAVIAEGTVLVVRQSFRAGLGLVGGGRGADEPPSVAAARELAEEVGLAVRPDQLRPAATITLVHESRPLLVHLFELELVLRPAVIPDGAEVVATEWIGLPGLRGRSDLHPVLGRWLEVSGR